MKTKIYKNNNAVLAPVVANEKGEIFDIEGFGAVAMQGGNPVLLTRGQTIEMPYGSELMMLPDHKPIVFNFSTEEFQVLDKNPYDPDESIYPVAVFNSPGYVNRYFCAYEYSDILLPLFSYCATGWDKDGFRSAAICIETEKRQDLRLMPIAKVKSGIAAMQKKYPDNRLIRHIEKCALVYGCPAAKNFFIGRYEAPLPTSRTCNANCLGCISFQNNSDIIACQDRISFTPDPEEISELALEHILRVDKSIVSFGQGCEGDPLTAFHVIKPAIEAIRKKTSSGTINMNTNASMPDRLAELFDSGLDSIRVSMNSVREACYLAYYRPKSYTFSDVLKSIEIAGEKGKFVSINYLNCPGVTDCELEFHALKKFLRQFPVKMIQWRNLNYDPLHYLRIMEKKGGNSRPVGMDFMIKELMESFPDLIHGYFNPPKEQFYKKDR